jgi:hypothetical protein
MTGSDWLRVRIGDAPPNLLSTMVEALPSEEMPVPDALASGALTLYERVVRGSGGREDALPLLAGDALFTHAFEAVAEIDPGSVAAFAARWGARGALARVAPDV